MGAIPYRHDANLLVGYGSADDGAVYRLDNGTCLIQTVDFFTPIVDDPFQYGEIAAANALSDVYAMGGRPVTALSLVCYPYKTWPADMLQQIMAGGASKIEEAGSLVVGGHSVQDAEIKFGFAITGTVAEKNIWRNDTPRAGDALVLSKPLGTGTLTTAVKQNKLDETILDAAIREMSRLNAAAAVQAKKYKVSAVTDITGFGLMGHLYEMVRGAGYGAHIRCENLPVLPGAWDAIAAEAFTGAHKTNRVYVADYHIPETSALIQYGQLLFDPQTSGGLLIALPPADAKTLAADLCREGHTAAVIGDITERATIQVTA